MKSYCNSLICLDNSIGLKRDELVKSSRVIRVEKGWYVYEDIPFQPDLNPDLLTL